MVNKRGAEKMWKGRKEEVCEITVVEQSVLAEEAEARFLEGILKGMLEPADGLEVGYDGTGSKGPVPLRSQHPTSSLPMQVPVSGGGTRKVQGGGTAPKQR